MLRSVLRQATHAVAPVLAIVLTGLLTVGSAPQAFAHAELVSSTPASGAGVAEMPGRIALTFSEPVRTPAFVEVTAPGGSEVTTGTARIRDRRVTRPLDPSSAAGAYTVAYRVTSADGHAITGTFRFRHQPADGQDAEAPTSPDPSPEATSSPTPADSPTQADEPEQTADAEPVAADDGDGPGAGLVLLLGAVVALGLVAVVWAARRALRT